MKYKKGDEIIINKGKDKGKKGKIERLFPQKGMILVPGLNVYKRHLKKRDEKNPGGIIDISKPFPLSKASIICPKCGKKTRIGYKVHGKDKLRICKRCEANI